MAEPEQCPVHAIAMRSLPRVHAGIETLPGLLRGQPIYKAVCGNNRGLIVGAWDPDWRAGADTPDGPVCKRCIALLNSRGVTDGDE